MNNGHAVLLIWSNTRWLSCSQSTNTAIHHTSNTHTWTHINTCYFYQTEDSLDLTNPLKFQVGCFFPVDCTITPFHGFLLLADSCFPALVATPSFPLTVVITKLFFPQQVDLRAPVSFQALRSQVSAWKLLLSWFSENEIFFYWCSCKISGWGLEVCGGRLAVWSQQGVSKKLFNSLCSRASILIATGALHLYFVLCYNPCHTYFWLL